MRKKIGVKGFVIILIGLYIWVNIFSGISGSKNVKDLNIKNVTFPKAHPAIMCTGYWNPTGLMLVPFSTDPELNPNGWMGENWEGLGYDIYSYFPEPYVYTGMFEVDYQDTWEDFWNVTSQIHPIAIISFGAGDGPWEIEYNARNLNSWINDNEPPYQPTPCPPDDTKPVGYVRHSTLPVQQIEDAVNNQTTLTAWVDWGGNPGAYLCEYIAYLGMWYQDIHNATEDLCRAAGFIHVNAGVAVQEAMNATNISLRETIKYISNQPPTAPTLMGPTDGKIGTVYNYTVVSTDSNGDNVNYFIDWGDQTNSSWLGPYPSGQQITVQHSWEEKGVYLIKAKAKDVYGMGSNWSEPFEMTINPTYNFSVEIQGGFGVTATIKNIGDTELTNVQWTFTLTGGLIMFGKTKSGTLMPLAPGASKTIKDTPILGFGKTTITVDVTCAEGKSVTKSATGTVFLFFVLGVK